MSDEEPITLCGEDGIEHVCRVLEVFPFEDQDYALLLDLGEANAEPSAEPDAVLMRVVEKGGKSAFRTIDDEEEFARVTAYIKELMAAMDEEDEEDDEDD